jgi:hypothetical protein
MAENARTAQAAMPGEAACALRPLRVACPETGEPPATSAATGPLLIAT